MKHALLRAILFLTLIPSAQAASCPPVTPTVTLTSAEPTLDRSLDARLLRQKAPELHLAADSIFLGLYNGMLKTEIKSATLTETKLNQGANTCFSQFSISISLTPVIYILHEITPSGCADQVVWEHEYTHHRIEIAKINETLPFYLSNNPLPLVPFFGHTVPESNAAAQTYAQVYISTLNKSLSNFIRPAQAAFDSPGEQHRVRSSCPAEISQILSLPSMH